MALKDWKRVKDNSPGFVTWYEKRGNYYVQIMKLTKERIQELQIVTQHQMIKNSKYHNFTEKQFLNKWQSDDSGHKPEYITNFIPVRIFKTKLRAVQFVKSYMRKEPGDSTSK